LPHFEITAFLAAVIGLLGLISLCLLVFGRLGVGSIVAFLVAGIVIGQVRDIPAQTILAVHEFAEIGVILMLFLSDWKSSWTNSAVSAATCLRLAYRNHLQRLLIRRVYCSGSSGGNL